MACKPIKRRDYDRWIRRFGWSLVKGGIDWNLLDAEGNWVCTVKVTHPGGEVPGYHVQLTTRKLKERGFIS
jgi:hypothetical protein